MLRSLILLAQASRGGRSGNESGKEGSRKKPPGVTDGPLETNKCDRTNLISNGHHKRENFVQDDKMTHDRVKQRRDEGNQRRKRDGPKESEGTLSNENRKSVFIVSLACATSEQRLLYRGCVQLRRLGFSSVSLRRQFTCSYGSSYFYVDLRRPLLGSLRLIHLRIYRLGSDK